MRFEDIKLESLDTNLGNGALDGSFYISATEELIEITNKIRKRNGNADLVGVDYDNDVYYDHYLIFNADAKEIFLEAVIAHGEKDDYKSYKIDLFPEEKEMLMWKVVKALLIDIEE